ncbi:MAG TPA: hypothetical protein VFD77_04080 [Brumimicrobium sp.]|nr:hypothetical protein [Brumimicrobium sp.]
MKFVQYTIVLLLVTFLTSCNKNEKYSIKGRVMYGCDSLIVNDNRFLLTQKFQEASLIPSKKEPIYRGFFTDEDGRFEIIYKRKEAVNTDLEFYFNKNHVYEGIPAFQDVDLGNVYVGNTFVSYVIKLDVDGAYTANDTLVIKAYNQPQIEIPGPFQNMVIDTVYNYPYFRAHHYTEGVEIDVINYKIINSSLVRQGRAEFLITKFCTNELFDAVIKIE